MARWLRANLRTMGCDLEEMSFADGIETVICALRINPPKACSLQDFYQGIFKKEPEPRYKLKPRTAGMQKNTKSKRLYGDNIQTAEQYEMLAKMGLAVDKREKKDDSSSNV